MDSTVELDVDSNDREIVLTISELLPLLEHHSLNPTGEWWRKLRLPDGTFQLWHRYEGEEFIWENILWVGPTNGECARQYGAFKEIVSSLEPGTAPFFFELRRPGVSWGLDSWFEIGSGFPRIVSLSAFDGHRFFTAHATSFGAPVVRDPGRLVQLLTDKLRRLEGYQPAALNPRPPTKHPC